MAAHYLLVNGVLYVVLGVLFVLRGALQGLGQTVVPTLTGVVELVCRVGAAGVLGAGLRVRRRGLGQPAGVDRRGRPARPRVRGGVATPRPAAGGRCHDRPGGSPGAAARAGRPVRWSGARASVPTGRWPAAG